MESRTHRFDMVTQPKKSIIKVIGVGGGGGNAVNNMYKRGIQDVTFIVCNTDEQALQNSPVQHKLQIGINLTSGLGAGANPEVGKNAAIESKEEIQALLNDGTKMLFVTAGMGGGTGTGAAPVIASIASKLGILTVGIVTLPFAFEGKKKLLQAQAGIKELRQHCDTVLVILNDRLRQVLGNLSIGNAFAQADNVLTTAAKSIAEIITVPGYVNVDFEDVKTVMKKAGAAVMGSAQAEGEGRARKAAELALTSPLLDYKDIHGAKKILLSIVSGQEAEMHMDELATITDYIQEQVGEDAEMIFGHGSDKQLKESIRVTVIATGFEDKQEDTGETNHVTNKTDAKQVPGKSSQGYLFEGFSSRNEEEAKSNELKHRYDTFKKQTQPQQHIKNNRRPFQPIRQGSGTLPLPFDLLEEKKQILHEKAQNRIKELAKQQATVLSEEDLRDYLDVPAYLRKDIQLEEKPAMDEKNIIRHYLNEQGGRDIE
ncbi:MAG: cell division protein FtsZ [Candidatus Amoebophilus sp. 36-38]|nr:MAG: cell division protein FtsZ [Candidatus Amoebophilus sp. 36-38]